MRKLNRSNRLTVLTAVLLCFGLILSVPIQSFALNPMFPKAIPILDTTYVDEVYGFQIDPPKNWNVIDIDGGLVSFSPYDVDTVAIMMMYSQYPPIPQNALSKLSSNSELKTTFEDGMHSVLIDGVKDYYGASNVKFSKPKFSYYADGLKFSITYAVVINESGTNSLFRGNMIGYYLEGGDGYMIIYAADKTNYKKYLPAFTKSAKSFYAFPVTEDFE